MTEPDRTHPLIDHVGVLVGDIDEAIDRWSQVLGYTFTPVMNYRTEAYHDSSAPDPHHHDAKISFSIEGPPYVELMEFTGEGTHSAGQGEGFHHLGFRVEDAEHRQRVLASIGVGAEGQSLDPEGRPILWFTDPGDLNDMRLEYVGAQTQPVFDADGELVLPPETAAERSAATEPQP